MAAPGPVGVGDALPAVPVSDLDLYYAENKSRLPLNQFKTICSMVSYGELLRLRATCKYWNQIIVELPTYLERNGQVLNKTWMQKRAKHVNLLNVAHWRTLNFNRYCFARNYFSRSIWPRAQLTITTLVFKGVTLRCHQMATILNETTNLDSISLIKVNFPNPLRNYATPNPARHILCNHPTLERALKPTHYYGPPVTISPGQITKVVCQGITLIPNCVLLLLIARSRTGIREFEFSKSVRPTPDNFVPSALEVENMIATKLLTLRPNNVTPAPLQKLKLQSITSDLSILPSITRGDSRIALQELTLAQQDGNSTVQTDRIMDFLRWQEPKNTLRKVDLMVQNTWNVDQLFVILVGMDGLQKLRLHFGPRDLENRNVNLIPLQHLHSLTDLEVSTAPKIGEDLINRGYLGYLRPTLRRLCLDHPGITEQDLIRFLDSRGITNLKEFHVLKGQGVTNAVMAHIIRMLPLLEKLTVNDSVALTDTGFLGWPKATIDYLLRTNSYASIVNAKETPGGNVGPNIKELFHLQSLNLHRCTKVSDISVIRGFQLPHLREIDITSTMVTDLGLLWLAHNAPGLEKVTCKKSNKIARFGLNQLITSFPTIMKVYTSKQLVEKTLGNIRFANSARYPYVVVTTQ